MARPTAEQIREQILRDADRDALAHPCPEPTVEQMRRVGQVLRGARKQTRDST